MGAVCGRVEVAIDATTQTKRYMNVNHVGNIFYVEQRKERCRWFFLLRSLPF